MAQEDGTVIVHTKTPESKIFAERTRRAMMLTPRINRLSFDDADEIRTLFSELTGREVDPHFRLIPPFYTAYGLEIYIGQRVFINQNCTLYDLAEIRIGDDVMLGPNVNLITAGHPLAPSQRRAYVQAKPIVIERNVWIATGATVIGGVTIGENSVVAAGAVVTKNVPPNSLVAGNPARIVRAIDE